MKKKFLVLMTLAVVSVMGLATVASAVPRWVLDDVKWRTRSTTFSGNYADSSLKSAATTANVFRGDTTADINIGEWATAPQIHSDSTGQVAVTRGDTLVFGVAYWYMVGSSVTAASDSFHIVGQVSNDGANWLTWGTPVSTFDAAFGTAATSLYSNAVLVLPFATNGGGYLELLQSQPATVLTAGGLSAPAAAAPTPGQLYGWRFLRFIVVGDHSGQFRFKVGHWKEVLGINKLVTDRINWRTTSGFTADPDGYADSAFVKHSSVKIDTSAGIAVDWGYVPNETMQRTANADSMLFAQVLFVPNENTLPAGFTSTVYTAVDVSLDGTNWLAASQFPYTAAQVSTTKHSFMYLKQGSARTVSTPTSNNWIQGPRMPVCGTAPGRSQLFGFPFIRFRLTATITGQFEGYIRHWKVIEPAVN